MGTSLKDNMNLFGGKFTGPDYFLEGAAITDVNFIFALAPPTYYAQATGNSAQGWMMLVDYVLLSQSSHGPNFMHYYGLGPMVRYSHFEVTLGNATKTAYNLDDFILGLKINLGLAFKIASVALRSELNYYWEKSQYLGAGLSLQFQF
jgi:hypothetical protein